MINVNLEKFGKISATLAFLLCVVGGLSTIYGVVGGTEDFIWPGLGIYFIGKAFFVGPSLLISSGVIK